MQILLTFARFNSMQLKVSQLICSVQTVRWINPKRMASLQYFIKHRQCRISSYFFFFECVTLHENPEPEAIFVYKGHQPVIILFADMFHRCGAAATRPGDYNIQNHVRWINPDLLRHVSSFPVLKRISRCKDCKAATAAHLKA